MNQLTATIISNEQLWGASPSQPHPKYLGASLIWLKCPELAPEAKPGQFVMVSCGGEECPLPRPLSIHQTSGENLALLYAILAEGRGTKWLSERRNGKEITLTGMLGNGFSIPEEPANLLLVAGGNGIAPLYFLAQKAIKAGHSITLLYGTADRNRKPIPPHIKTISATEDGSVGHRGTVTDLIPKHIDWAEQVFACGPVAMYRELHAHRKELLQDKPVQLSLEVRMGCGLGVCFGCTVKTKTGLKQVCKDGPVFNLDDILWDELV